MDAIDILLTTTLWAAAVRIAAPYVFGTLGELICERAGVLNLGIEGIMTAGAFAGWYTVYAGGDLWTGVLVAALTGAAFGLLHGVLVVPLGLSQHVVGIGITLFASSLTYYSYRVLFPKVTSPPRIPPFEPFANTDLLQIPLVGEALFQLSLIPFFGEVLFHQTPLTYLSFILVGIAAYVLYRTPLGLAVRTVGENPAAVEAQGIDVTLLRIGGGDGGKRHHGDRRRLSDHVGLQCLLLRDGQRPRLDLHCAGGVRHLGGRARRCWARCCSALFDAYQLRLQQLAGAVSCPIRYF